MSQALAAALKAMDDATLSALAIAEDREAMRLRREAEDLQRIATERSRKAMAARKELKRRRPE